MQIDPTNGGRNIAANSDSVDPNAGVANNFEMTETAPGSFVFTPKAPQTEDPRAAQQAALEAQAAAMQSSYQQQARSQSFVFGSTHEQLNEVKNQGLDAAVYGEQTQGGVVINGVTYSPEQAAALRAQGAETINPAPQPRQSTMAQWQAANKAQPPQAPQGQQPQAPSAPVSKKTSGWWKR